MAGNDEKYYAGGGREFLILKSGKYWEVRELNHGICAGSLHFERETAERCARKYISEAIADKTGIKPKVIEAFLKVRGGDAQASSERSDASSKEST